MMDDSVESLLAPSVLVSQFPDHDNCAHLRVCMRREQWRGLQDEYACRVVRESLRLPWIDVDWSRHRPFRPPMLPSGDLSDVVVHEILKGLKEGYFGYSEDHEVEFISSFFLVPRKPDEANPEGGNLCVLCFALLAPSPFLLIKSGKYDAWAKMVLFTTPGKILSTVLSCPPFFIILLLYSSPTVPTFSKT